MKRSFLTALAVGSFGMQLLIAGEPAQKPLTIGRAAANGFLENKGQMADMNGQPIPGVYFRAEAPGVNLYLTEKGLTYVFVRFEKEKRTGEPSRRLPGDIKKHGDKLKIHWERIDLELPGANISKNNIITDSPSLSYSNYYLSHCPQGVLNVKRYQKLTVKNIYPGIDWVLYNAGDKGFKYDFIVHPGADPSAIRLVYRSLQRPELIGNGGLELKSSLGSVEESAPVSWMQESGRLVESHFEIKQVSETESQVSIHCQNPVTGETLVIDPQQTWGTFFGGNVHEGAQSISADAAGNVTSVGYLATTNFPVLNPGGGSYFQGTINGTLDAFLIKFNNAGVQLWATYFGGSSGEEANYVTNNTAGDLFITGYTDSPDLPVQNPGGGAYFQPVAGGAADIYLARFSPAGVLQWSTFYGGSGSDRGRSVRHDASGNILVTGITESSNFPTLNPGGGAYFQPTINGATSNAFILKFSPAGVSQWATYVGGSTGDGGMSVAPDANGNIVMVGYSGSNDYPVLNPGGGAFFQGAKLGPRSGVITRFNSALAMTWSTYFGGTVAEATTCVKEDQLGNIFVGGSGYSSGLPLVNPGGGAYYQPNPAGGNELFLLKFSATGIMRWGTMYGGSQAEGVYSADIVEVDPCNNVYLAFDTESPDVPLKTACDGGFNDNSLSGTSDLFITKFSNNGIQLWGTYLGGDGRDFSSGIAIDNNNSLFMTGEWSVVTNSLSYPLVNPGGGAYFDNSWAGGIDDSYVVKFETIPVVATATATPSACGCNGSATATVTGGCSPVKYQWYNSSWAPVGNTLTISNLCAGNYQFIAQDTLSCSPPDTAFVTVTGGAGSFTVTPSSTNPVCGQANGSATVTITGGTSPFTYVWNPSSQTTSSATGLSNGNYTVTITDASNCTSTQVITLNGTSSPTVNTTGTPVSCFGNNNGTASATVTGGGAPYTYNWSTGATTSQISNLTSQIYSVTVTDQNGCTSTATVNVTQPSALTLSTSATPAACGQSNGTASASVTGGSAPYTYNWSTGATTSQISNLTSQIYSITVTDASGCTSQATVNVSGGGNAITTNMSSTGVLCFGGNSGTATASPSGGTAPYTYAWNTGATTSQISNLTSQTYSVTVTDAAGCTSTQTVSITQPNALIISIISSPDTCNKNVGFAMVSASGGTAPYSYLWSNGSTNTMIAGLSSQTYSVLLTDMNGCIGTQTISVGSAGGLTVNAGADVSIQSGGSTQLNATGGTSYSWTPSTGLNNSSIANPVASPSGTTSYSVIVSDASGCTDMDIVTVYVILPCFPGNPVANAFSPNNDGENDLLCLMKDPCLQEFTLKIYNRWGELIFETTDANECWDGRWRGQELNTAVFVYYFEGEYSGGKKKEFKGNLTLLR